VNFGNLEANLRFLEGTKLLSASARMLEIGTGSGTLLEALRTRGLDIVGVERSPERIGEAHARDPGLPIQRVDGVELPFPDETFDVVLSFDVFEHIPDSDRHLVEVRRILKPGGWYLLQTPNKWTNSIFETIRWRSFTRWRADHCSLHTYGQLRERFARHGFDLRFDDVQVVTEFYRQKVRRYLGPVGSFALRVANPDRWPIALRTNFYVRARKQ
jgi:SAM-dependent methyltransferase